MLVVFYHVVLIMLPALFFVEGRVLRLIPEVLQFDLKELDGFRARILLQLLAGLPDSVLLCNRQVVGLGLLACEGRKGRRPRSSARSKRSREAGGIIMTKEA